MTKQGDKLMRCKECGYELSGDAMFCGKCGKSVSHGDKIKCRKCDYEMDSNLEYCPRCREYNSSRGDNRGKRDRGEDEDDDDEGGMLGNIGNFIGKLFGS